MSRAWIPAGIVTTGLMLVSVLGLISGDRESHQQLVQAASLGALGQGENTPIREGAEGDPQSAGEHDGDGVDYQQSVVVSNTVQDDFTWRVVGSTSSSGACLDAEVVSSWDGEPLGSIGGCGIDQVDFDPLTGFTSLSGEPVLSPVVGQIRTARLPREVGTPDSITHTVITGVATCECTVEATFADGSSLSSPAVGGTFLIHTTAAGTVGTIEAVDAAGTVIATTRQPQ